MITSIVKSLLPHMSKINSKTLLPKILRFFLLSLCFLLGLFGLFHNRCSLLGNPSKDASSSSRLLSSSPKSLLSRPSKPLTPAPDPSFRCGSRRCRMLHVSTEHPGVLTEMEVLADLLELDMDQRCSSCHLPIADFSAITESQANQIWNETAYQWCLDYDIILISDTITQARSFLQNNCSKKLILRITQRYDWMLWKDENYHELLRSVWRRDNVRVVPNNHMESWYALRIRNVYLKIDAVIPGFGLLSYTDYSDSRNADRCRVNDPENGMYLVRLHHDLIILQPILDRLGIPYVAKPPRGYCGPAGLRNRFLVHIPYQSSTMSLFENLGQGVVYAIPSQALMLEILKDLPCCLPDWPPPSYDFLNYTDWYFTGYRDLFIYFDNYEELRSLQTNLDLIERKRKNIAAFLSYHRNVSLTLWKRIIFENEQTVNGDRPRVI